eukprot:9486910-Pyramimonas_sp.AAC.1
MAARPWLDMRHQRQTARRRLSHARHRMVKALADPNVPGPLASALPRLEPPTQEEVSVTPGKRGRVPECTDADFWEPGSHGAAPDTEHTRARSQSAPAEQHQVVNASKRCERVCERTCCNARSSRLVEGNWRTRVRGGTCRMD